MAELKKEDLSANEISTTGTNNTQWALAVHASQMKKVREREGTFIEYGAT